MPRPIPWDPPEPVACRTWEAARMLGVSDGTVLRLARVAAARDERSDRPCVLLDMRSLRGSSVTLLLLPGEARLLAAQLDHETDDSHLGRDAHPRPGPGG